MRGVCATNKIHCIGGLSKRVVRDSSPSTQMLEVLNLVGVQQSQEVFNVPWTHPSVKKPRITHCGSDTGGGFFSIQWAAGVARVADRGLGHRRVKPWSSHRFCPLAYGSEPVAALMLDNRRSLLDPWNGRLGALLEILLVSGDQGALGLRSSWANSWRRRRHFSPIFLRASSPIPRVISSISSRLVNNP